MSSQLTTKFLDLPYAVAVQLALELSHLEDIRELGVARSDPRTIMALARTVEGRLEFRGVRKVVSRS